MLWQFTLNNLEKIDIVKNQTQFVEMFLIRSLYLKKKLNVENKPELKKLKKDIEIDKTIIDSSGQTKKETINQLKNVEQQEKKISAPEVKNKSEGVQIKSLKDLIEICEHNKELKIKYEIENNVRLVSFEDNKIEISFNSNLDKTFIKELSYKLLEWTKTRWIIAFSKKDGMPTIKEEKKKSEKNLLEKEYLSDFSNEIKKIFPDAELLKLEEEK